MFMPQHQIDKATPVEDKSTAYELNPKTLQDLVDNKVAAIHVRGFYPKDIAEKVALKALDHPQLGYYNKKYTSSVGRICTPHIDSEWNEAEADKYHGAAIGNIHALRQLFYPYVSPVDHVRLLLQEMWPAGANIQRLHERTCFVGAFRVFHPVKSSFFPHYDRLEEETAAPEISGLIQQLVANIYLQVPENGGDLQLWLREATESESTLVRDVEGLLPEAVEPPRVVIHPHAGDLIIFSSRQLHAVTPGIDSARVGMAAFIGCYGPSRPLTYWS
jgi:hypothetical protein